MSAPLQPSGDPSRRMTRSFWMRLPERLADERARHDEVHEAREHDAFEHDDARAARPSSTGARSRRSCRRTPSCRRRPVLRSDAALSALSSSALSAASSLLSALSLSVSISLLAFPGGSSVMAVSWRVLLRVPPRDEPVADHGLHAEQQDDHDEDVDDQRDDARALRRERGARGQLDRGRRHLLARGRAAAARRGAGGRALPPRPRPLPSRARAAGSVGADLDTVGALAVGVAAVGAHALLVVATALVRVGEDVPRLVQPRGLGLVALLAERGLLVAVRAADVAGRRVAVDAEQGVEVVFVTHRREIIFRNSVEGEAAAQLVEQPGDRQARLFHRVAVAHRHRVVVERCRSRR